MEIKVSICMCDTLYIYWATLLNKNLATYPRAPLNS